MINRKILILIALGVLGVLGFVSVVHSSTQINYVTLYPIYDIVGRPYTNPIGSIGEQIQTQQAQELFKGGIR